MGSRSQVDDWRGLVASPSYHCSLRCGDVPSPVRLPRLRRQPRRLNPLLFPRSWGIAEDWPYEVATAPRSRVSSGVIRSSGWRMRKSSRGSRMKVSSGGSRMRSPLEDQGWMYPLEDQGWGYTLEDQGWGYSIGLRMRIYSRGLMRMTSRWVRMRMTSRWVRMRITSRWVRMRITSRWEGGYPLEE